MPVSRHPITSTDHSSCIVWWLHVCGSHIFLDGLWTHPKEGRAKIRTCKTLPATALLSNKGHRGHHLDEPLTHSSVSWQISHSGHSASTEHSVERVLSTSEDGCVTESLCFLKTKPKLFRITRFVSLTSWLPFKFHLSCGTVVLNSSQNKAK